MKKNDREEDLLHMLIPDRIRRLMGFDRRGRLMLLSILFVVIAMSCIWSYNKSGHIYELSTDEASYYSASQLIMSGQIDSFRTPLYPLLISLMTLVFKNVAAAYTAIVVLQWLVFTFAWFCLGRILRYFGVREILVFCVLLSMLFSPLTFRMNHYILTESLSLSFLIFFIWLCIGCSESPSLKNQSYAWGMVLLMLSLRPSWIFLVPVMVVFVALCVWNNKYFRRSAIISGILLPLAVVGTVCGYIAGINHKYHFNSISIVTTINNFSFMKDTKTFPLRDFGNDGLIAAVDSCYRVPYDQTGYYSQAWYLIDRFGMPEVTRFVNTVMAENKALILRKTAERFVSAGHEPIDLLPVIMPMPINILYLALLGWTYVLLRMMYVRKRCGGMLLILYLLYAGIIVTGIAGAPVEHTRLIYSSMIPLTIALGICSNYLQLRKPATK